MTDTAPSAGFDSINDRTGTEVGQLRILRDGAATRFQFTPTREGLLRGFVFRLSESFPTLWRGIHPTHFHGRRTVSTRGASR